MIDYNLRMWLLAGTVPAFKKLLAGTIPAFKKLLAGTIPAFKRLLAGAHNFLFVFNTFYQFFSTPSNFFDLTLRLFLLF